MSSLAWYWHRLRAMRPDELAAHGRRKLHQLSDAFLSSNRFSRVADVPAGSTYPILPAPAAAPELVRTALRRDADAILARRWMAFGYLELQLDDPPRWHKDYLVGVDLTTQQRALKLHHRLQGTADIKLIWEPSRWYSLVRLAQAAYVLGDLAAAEACVKWLEDWCQFNRPYYGWHWTSGLESGIRLIQFTWIDALLERFLANCRSAQPAPEHARLDQLDSALARVRAAMLPPHLWFTWRERSFGSSANNHVLGEFAGLILALVRWPALASWAVSLDTLQPLWERQVLAQFGQDGGNREQALNYHLFGWEFCWQARLALAAAGRTLSPEVEDRLRAGAGFFSNVQAPDEQWDYGDSDNAYVSPFFVEWPQATSEWHWWFQQPGRSPGIAYWLGDPPKAILSPAVVSGAKGWRVFQDTGIAICRAGDWFVRWDLSPLGFLSTAGHGHCDALHLSLWLGGRAIVIDPGTGVYHSDPRLRAYLTSWDAHNGPHPAGLSLPQRTGTFLWASHHGRPRWKKESEWSMSAELAFPHGVMRRRVTRLEAEDGWEVNDTWHSTRPAPAQDVRVFWQLAPGLKLQAGAGRTVQIRCESRGIEVQFGSGWSQVESGMPSAGGLDPSSAALPRGVCAPVFRKITTAPFIALRGPVSAAGGLTTRFNARSEPAA